MTELSAADDLFSSRILQLEYTYDQPIDPIRILARDVFERTSPTSNQFPLPLNLLPGEQDAIEATSEILDVHADVKNLRQSWSTMRPDEKIGKLGLIINTHLKNLCEGLEKQLESAGLHSFNANLILNFCKLHNIEFGINRKPASFSHCPPDDGEGCINTAVISRQEGISAIDNYDLMLEVAFYIAARAHQAGLQIMVKVTDLPKDLNDAARIFQFTDDLVPYEGDHGAFVWQPDEFEKWLDQPKYRHALNHATAMIRELTLDPTYTLSEEFMRGWKSDFYSKCLETGISAYGLDVWQEDKHSSPRLDHFEKLFTLMGDEIKTLTANQLDNIHSSLNEAGEIPALRNRVHALNTLLMEKLPLYQLSRIDETYEETDSRFPVTALEIINTVGRLGYEFISNISINDRHSVLNRLFNVAAEHPDHRHVAAIQAIAVEANALSFAELDRIEDEKLIRLSQTIDRKPEFIEAKKSWPKLSQEQKFDILLKFAQLKARIFGSDRVADKIITFEEDKDSATAMITHARARTAETERIIEINVSKSCGVLNHFERALSVIVHEQTHLNDHGIMRNFIEKKLMPDDPYYRLAEMLLVDWHPWRQMTKEERKDETVEDSILQLEFYRVTPMERHAFSLENKFSAIREGREPPSERQILAKGSAFAPLP